MRGCGAEGSLLAAAERGHTRTVGSSGRRTIVSVGDTWADSYIDQALIWG